MEDKMICSKCHREVKDGEVYQGFDFSDIGSHVQCPVGDVAETAAQYLEAIAR